MQAPREYKDIKKLTGCLAVLSWFIFKYGERNLPFPRILGELLIPCFIGMINTLAKGFEQIVFEHIPHAQNEEVDHLSRIATTYYDELPKEVYVDIRKNPAHEETISLPLLEEPEDWRTPIAQYLATGQLPESVVFDHPSQGQGQARPEREGPYHISRVIGPGTCELERLNGDVIPRT
ncbi:hypothetical protein LIER_14597 [Lithospermum erythrorhizon]|uniref:Uncharacterized protein n=1 Tax=Lithospermum erythrorhizon TaxID=34254 RepID=A0AAV3Q3V1_LITER